MTYCFPFSANPVGVRLPYVRANAAQRALAAGHLRQRLAHHFPSLRPATWPQALADYQPDLWLTGPTVGLAPEDLTQLAQHLAAAPELPILDPPLYCLPALHLAQRSLQTSELAAWSLPEVAAAAPPCGPWLYALLCHLARPSHLAEQVVQAWCWNLASAPPLPTGIPGGRAAPGISEIEQLLCRIKAFGISCPGEAHGPFLPPHGLRKSSINR